MMSGWKTWASSLMLFGLGAYLIVKGRVEEGLMCVSMSGLGVGLGHKIEKAGQEK